MKPPVLARAIVWLFAPRGDRDFLLADLADRFAEVASTDGVRAAKLWYWGQALSVVPFAIVPDVNLIRRGSWAGVVGDVRLGLRTLHRSPLYALGVAGTLGLGLAAAMISFAVAWWVWLSPLPIPEPDKVVRLYEIAPPEPGGQRPQADDEERRHLFSDALAVDFHSHPWRTIESVGFVMGRGPGFEVTRDGEIYSLSGFALPREAFEILGIVPTLGRLPASIEDEFLLSERFWRATFGSDPGVLGSRFEFPGAEWSSEIVGVAPLPSGYPGDADVVSVFDWRVQATRDFRWYEVFARVRPEYSVAEAEAEMNAFLGALAEVYPEHRGWGVEAVPLAEDLIRPFRGVIGLLLAAGTTFLLLAAVNVLGLVAARRVDNRRERSIRLALGASEARLLRGSLIESIVLSSVGIAAGVIAARWLAPPLKAMVPQDVPRLADVAVTSPMLIAGLFIGLALGAVTGIFGYLASRDARPSVGRAPSWRSSRVGGRRALVVGQIALTTMLTAGTAAVLHRVTTLKAIDLGFEAEGVSTTSGDLSTVDDLERGALVRTIVDRLAVRGISSALAFNTPLNTTYGGDDFMPFSIRADAASSEVFYELHPVSPAYFSVMGIELIGGRAFRPADDGSSQRVVIVSEDFVEQYFGAGTPIEQVLGRELEPVMLVRGPATVVGVVRATRHQGPNTPALPSVYIPFTQQVTVPAGSLLLQGEPERLAEPVAEVLGQLTPDVRWTPLVPYSSYLSEWYAPFRFQLTMISVLAALGLLLASLGLYSLIAYQVAIDRKELAIRKALGARDGSLVLAVVARGAVMAMAGALIGLAAWYQLLPAAAELVQGIDSRGYLVPLSVAVVVGGSCLLATVAPALRVTRVDLFASLKGE